MNVRGVDALERLALESIMTPDDVADAIPPRPGWMADALCRERPEVEFVPLEVRGGNGCRSQAAAIEVCGSCLVRLECARYALADPTLVGVWGGLTAAERKAARAALDAATPAERLARPKKVRPRRLVVEDPWWTRSA